MNDPYSVHTRTLRALRGEGEDWLKRRDAEIRASREDGMTFRDIGNAVGLSHTGVEKIIKGSRVQDGAGSGQ